MAACSDQTFLIHSDQNTTFALDTRQMLIHSSTLVATLSGHCLIPFLSLSALHPCPGLGLLHISSHSDEAASAAATSGHLRCSRHSERRSQFRHFQSQNSIYNEVCLRYDPTKPGIRVPEDSSHTPRDTRQSPCTAADFRSLIATSNNLSRFVVFTQPSTLHACSNAGISCERHDARLHHRRGARSD